MIKIKSALNRFVKVFIISGLVSAGTVLNTFPTNLDITEIKKFAVVLIIAFLSGGIAALEKVYNWTPTPSV